MNKKKLVGRNTVMQANGNTADCEINGIHVVKPTNKVLNDVVLEYECIKKADYQNGRTSHHIRHHITTIG